jgi:hypothetical protein
MERNAIQSGMPVLGRGGERLGTVRGCTEDYLLVAKWPHRGRVHAVRYSEVTSLEGGRVHLAHGREALLSPGPLIGPVLSVRPIDPTAVRLEGAHG